MLRPAAKNYLAVDGGAFLLIAVDLIGTIEPFVIGPQVLFLGKMIT